METTLELETLAGIEGTPCVTLYLNTRLKEPNARERARQFVRRRIERALRVAANDAVRADLERVRDEGLRRVESPDGGAPAAIAVFACGAKDVFRVVELAVPIEDQLVVSESPALKQIAALSGSYERTLLVLVSADDARVFEILLGEVTSEESLVGDPINKNRAPRTSPGWTDLHYQRQVREQIERHLREVAARTVALYDRGKPPRLVVGGAQPTIDRFLHELPDRLRTRVVDVVALNPTAPITAVVHAAIAQSAGASDGVREAVDLALSDGPAALGLDEVLDAAQQKRLMVVYLDPELRRDGWRCESCGALARRDDGSHTCGFCSAKTHPVELGEALVRQAIVQGGEVDFVPRSQLLAKFDGVAAKLRW